MSQEQNENEKRGKFICELRKSQNLTQKDLAEALNVTDKAVSKWERGISCPDVSLFMPLAEILGVSPAELLNGEKNQDMEQPKENIVAEAMLYSHRNTSNKIDKIRQYLFAGISASFMIAVVTSLICDFCITGQFSWSLLVISSLLFSWIILLPLFKAKKYIIRKHLVAISLGIIPYLFSLSILLRLPVILTLGSVVSVISLIGLWCIYFIFFKMNHRLLYATGLFFLVTVPLTWGINCSVAFHIQEPLDKATILVDTIVTISMIFLAAVCFAWEHSRVHSRK